MRIKQLILCFLLLAWNFSAAQNSSDRWSTKDYFPESHFIVDNNNHWEEKAGEVAFCMRLADIPSWKGMLAPKGTVRLRVSMLPQYAHPLFITVEMRKDSGTMQVRRGKAISGYVEHSRYYEMTDTGYVDVTETKHHGNVWENGFYGQSEKPIDPPLFTALKSALDEADLPNSSHAKCWGGFQPQYVIEYMDSEHYNAIYDECYDGALGRLVEMLVSIADSSCIDMAVHSPNKYNGIKPAHFPGGVQSMQDFISSNMQYPKLALLDGEEFSLHLDLVVERDGSLFCINNNEKDKYGFYDEARRIISIMPRWQPAMKEGKAVRSEYTCPFKFKLPPHRLPSYGTPTLETNRDSTRWESILSLYRKTLRHPNNQTYLYKIGMQYYAEFLLPSESVNPPTERDSFFFEKNWNSYYDRTPVIKGAADSALHYFYRALSATDSIVFDRYIDVYLPIRQLEQYLHLPNNPANRLPYDTLPALYYPATYFADMNQYEILDSATDYSTSLMDSYFWTNVMSEQLNAANEPVLYNKSVSPGDTLLRLAFYPSFHPPLIFRVEHTSDSTLLYWTKLDYTIDKGTWEKTYHPIQGRQRLAETEYKTISRLLAEFDFEHLKRMPSYDIIIADGAQWCIERRTSTEFKAHFAKIAGNKYQVLYNYLTKLARIDADYASDYYF